MADQMTLVAQMEKASKRLQTATAQAVQHAEPLHVLQRLKWESMLLRAELTALRDQIATGRLGDLVELQKRTKAYMEQYTQMICDQLGISISDDGTVAFTKTSDKILKATRMPGRPH